MQRSPRSPGVVEYVCRRWCSVSRSVSVVVEYAMCGCEGRERCGG
ncbi:hypothetical protein Hdeb2414_s0003g00100191 [Helianthus debilis subsp. tardiflorus]